MRLHFYVYWGELPDLVGQITATTHKHALPHADQKRHIRVTALYSDDDSVDDDASFPDFSSVITAECKYESAEFDEIEFEQAGIAITRRASSELAKKARAGEDGMIYVDRAGLTDAQQKAIRRAYYGVDEWLDSSLVELEGGTSLGSGHFSNVRSGTLAAQTGEQLPVAIKIAKSKDEDTAAAFLEEVQLLTQTNHPNIVQFFGLVIMQNCRVLVLARHDGDLVHLMESQQDRLTMPAVLSIAKQCLSAMSYLATILKVVCTDINPANILYSLEADGQLKICLADCGFAGSIAALAAKSETPPFVYVEDYIPPELRDGVLQFNEVSVAAFMVCLFARTMSVVALCTNRHLMNGSTYFPCPDPSSLFFHSSQIRQRQQWLRTDFMALMHRCWHPVSEERPELTQVESALNQMEPTTLMNFSA